MRVRFVGARILAFAVTVSFAASLALAEPDAFAGGRQRQTVARPSDLGPDMVEYMSFLDSEEAELRYYLDGHEMPPEQYRVAKDKLDITRAEALRIARERGDDVVPELYVLRAEELTQVLADGLAALQGKRAGDRVGPSWIYHGSVRRSAVFYVLERTSALGVASGS